MAHERAQPREHAVRYASRRASVMVEFAIIALVSYVFLATILTFGQSLYSGQVLQAGADLVSREASRLPLPAEITFDELLAAPVVPNGTYPVGDPRARFSREVYTEDYLIIDITPWVTQVAPYNNETLSQFLSDATAFPAPIPVGNKALVPLMYTDDQISAGKYYLRYPGAVIQSSTAPSGYSVAIPIIIDYSGPNHNGPEIIRWSRVIEEIRDPADPTGPFPLSSPQRGMSALRANFPSQSASMSARAIQPLNANGTPSANALNIIPADDSGVTVIGPGPGGSLVSTGTPGNGSTYGGTYGLGVQLALTQEVRPYRLVLSSQAIFRRELVE